MLVLCRLIKHKTPSTLLWVDGVVFTSYILALFLRANRALLAHFSEIVVTAKLFSTWKRGVLNGNVEAEITS